MIHLKMVKLQQFTCFACLFIDVFTDPFKSNADAFSSSDPFNAFPSKTNVSCSYLR